MSIPENQIQNTMAEETPAAQVVVPGLADIEKMTKEDLLKLKSDAADYVFAVESAIKAYAVQEEQKIKAEAEAKWQAFFNSSSFKAIHLSLTTITLIGVAFMLVKQLL
jgi:hypothetical protein